MYIYMSLYDVTDDNNHNHNHSNDNLICIKILHYFFSSSYSILFYSILVLRFLTSILLICFLPHFFFQSIIFFVNVHRNFD